MTQTGRFVANYIMLVKKGNVYCVGSEGMATATVGEPAIVLHKLYSFQYLDGDTAYYLLMFIKNILCFSSVMSYPAINVEA